MSSLYNINIKNYNIMDGEDNFYIHFKTIDECDNFKNIMKNCIFGDKCCYGRGVHFKSHDGIKITSYDHIHELKIFFKKSFGKK